MDNMNRPTGDGDPQDSRATGQFWAPPPGSSGRGPPGPAAGPPERPGLDQHYARDRRHALRWSIGLTLAAVLAAGGVIAGVGLAGHGTTASGAPASDVTAASGTGSAAGQPQSQAAALSSTLNAADQPGVLTLTSASGTAAAATTARPCRPERAAFRAAVAAGRLRLARTDRIALAECRGIRRPVLRFFLLRGVDGQFTVRTLQGTLRTLAFERGVVQSVSSSAVVVRAADGTTWTWDLVGNTVVREHGQKTSASSLATGDPVWVGGPVVSGAKDARLIVIRPPTPPTAPAATTPAPSASGS